eukprot:m.187084 g.187084  ORF g.187084 m.187084 type:complete len:181 (-) comp16973_c0_seq1:38-580(-)
MRNIKVCLLGSGSVGKSALAIQFTDERFVESYDPTVEDCYKKIFEQKGEQVSLEIIDTAGTEQFTSMVELYIRNCIGFILVYDVTKRTSFEGLDAIKEMVWRVKKAKPKQPPPMVIAGNKIDMPDREVLLGQGHTKAKEWGASFFETSAKTKEHVDDIFREIVNIIIKRDKKSKGGCTLL